MRTMRPFVIILMFMMVAPTLAMLVPAEDKSVPPDPSRDTDGRAIIRNWDIVVAFEFGPTPNKLQDVVDGLKWANNVLFDATEGQFRWKHATIWTHGKYFSDSDTDIQILDTGPTYRANAIRGGIDIPGGTVRLGKTMYGMKWNSTYGAMTMAHEWSHYALYQYDEYDDVDIGGGQIVSVPWCNFTLMANATDIDRDTEFCTPDIHNYDHSTETWDKCGWEVIKQYYPVIVMPSTRAELQQDGPFIPDQDQMTFDIHYADLYVEPSDITMDPPAPLEGQGVKINVKVHNKDSLLNGDVVEVRVYDGPVADGDLIDTKSISLSGNQIDEVEVNWVAEGGPHDIYVRVDPNNMVDEMNEYDNNTANRTFNIPARPTISPLLGDITVDEDVPVVLDLKQYESDIESPDEDLLWSVYAYDDTAIGSIVGENSPEDIINLTPKANYFGTTDVTLMLTDGDYMTDARTINITWTAVNDLPKVGTMTLGQDWVYRTTPVLITFDGTDAEDASQQLSPVLEYSLVNSSSWEAVSPAPVFEALFFSSLFTPDADMELGMYDLRARLIDTALKPGEYIYMNGSLWIRNYPGTISDYDLAAKVAYRGQPLPIKIEGTDAETDGDDLMVEVQYKPRGEDSWSDGGTFDDKTAGFDDDTWSVPFVPGTGSPRGLCDIRVRLVDPDGPGTWLYINDTVDIKNSRPVVEAVTTESKEIYRTEGITIVVKGYDHENENGQLELKLEYELDGSGTWKVLDPDDFEVTYDDVGQEWQIVLTPPKDQDLGKYDIRASLTDVDRETGDPTLIDQTFEIKNNPPDVAITAKTVATVGQVLDFDSKGTSDIEDGTSLKYAWDFDDGSRSTKSRASHSFNKEGRFQVKLTVTDRDGGSTTEEITVAVSGGGVGTVGGDMTMVIGAVAVAVVMVVVVLILFMRMKGIGPFG